MAPYTNLDSTDQYKSVYQIIKDDDVPRLDIYDDNELCALASMQLRDLDEDEQILTIVQDEDNEVALTLRSFNAFLAGVNFKATSCLKHLVSKFGIRMGMLKGQYNVKFDNIEGTFEFHNLLFPVIVRNED